MSASTSSLYRTIYRAPRWSVASFMSAKRQREIRTVMAPGPVFPVPFPARTGQGRVGLSLFPSWPGNGTGRDSLLIPGQYHIVPVPTNT
jgi:hypothetical protein